MIAFVISIKFYTLVAVLACVNGLFSLGLLVSNHEDKGIDLIVRIVRKDLSHTLMGITHHRFWKEKRMGFFHNLSSEVNSDFKPSF